MMVLGIEVRTMARATRAHNYRAISLALDSGLELTTALPSASQMLYHRLRPYTQGNTHSFEFENM